MPNLMDEYARAQMLGMGMQPMPNYGVSAQEYTALMNALYGSPTPDVAPRSPIPPALAPQTVMGQTPQALAARDRATSSAPAPLPTPQRPLSLGGAPQQPLSLGGPMGGVGGPMGGAGKIQDRLPLPMATKGDKLPMAPGVAPAPGAAGGAAPGGAAPSAQPQLPAGMATWQNVVKSILDADPSLKTRKDGKIIAAKAAMTLMPFMNQQSQQEFRLLTQQLKMQTDFARLQQGEERIKMQQEKLKDYQAQHSAQGRAEKQYGDVFKRYQTAANNLALNPGSKELRAAFDKANKDLASAEAARSPTQAAPQTEALASYFTDLKTKGHGKEAHSNVIDAVNKVYPGLASGLSAQDQTKLAEMLIGDPQGAIARLQLLMQKLRGGVTEVGKSYGNYR